MTAKPSNGRVAPASGTASSEALVEEKLKVVPAVLALRSQLPTVSSNPVIWAKPEPLITMDFLFLKSIPMETRSNE